MSGIETLASSWSDRVAARDVDPGNDVVRIGPASGWGVIDLRELWEYRDLLVIFVARDLNVRYKQTVIGVAWVVLQPLLTLVIFTLVFGVFARVPSGGVPYPLFAFAALLPWNYFSQAVGRIGASLVNGSGLLSKVYFPRLILPLSSAVTPLVDGALGFVALLCLFAWYGIPPTWRMLVLVPLLILAVVAALSVGIWLAALNVRYRDVGHLTPFLLQAWMYLCPVAYPVRLVPRCWRFVYELNPMTGVIGGFRWALLGEAGPDPRALAVSVAGTSLLLLGGLIYFRRMEESLVDNI